MLSLRILLCALSTVTVMPFRQLEDDQALQQEVEFFDVPLTPSFPVLSLVPPIPSALLEEVCSKQSKQYKSTGKLLEKDEWPAVEEEVQEQGSWRPWRKRGSQKHFAWKKPDASSWQVYQQGKFVLEREVGVMVAANKHNCPHVLPMIMSDPCVDGKQQQYSFVTTLLPYDLRKWGDEQTSKKKAHCYPVVAKAVYAGLECLHASGYIHGGLKDDKILFEDFDADGCPSGIVLGDFGRAQKIGNPIPQLPASDYNRSFHLVASFFDGQSDPLGLKAVSPKIDYCSWAMLVTYIFGLPEDKDLTEQLGKGSCGPMGPGRRKLYP